MLVVFMFRLCFCMETAYKQDKWKTANYTCSNVTSPPSDKLLLQLCTSHECSIAHSTLRKLPIACRVRSNWLPIKRVHYACHSHRYWRWQSAHELMWQDLGKCSHCSVCRSIQLAGVYCRWLSDHRKISRSPRLSLANRSLELALPALN